MTEMDIGSDREAWACLPRFLWPTALRQQPDWGLKAVVDTLVFLKDGEYMVGPGGP